MDNNPTLTVLSIWAALVAAVAALLTVGLTVWVVTLTRKAVKEARTSGADLREAVSQLREVEADLAEVAATMEKVLREARDLAFIGVTATTEARRRRDLENLSVVALRLGEVQAATMASPPAARTGQTRLALARLQAALTTGLFADRLTYTRGLANEDAAVLIKGGGDFGDFRKAEEELGVGIERARRELINTALGFVPWKQPQ